MKCFPTIGVVFAALLANAVATEEKLNAENEFVVNVDRDAFPKEIQFQIQGTKALDGFTLDFMEKFRLRKLHDQVSTPAPTYPTMTDDEVEDLVDQCDHGYHPGNDEKIIQKFITKFGMKAVVNAKAPLKHGVFSGHTCLHSAAGSGWQKIVTLMLENGAEIDARGEYGETPLRMAITWDQLETVTTLVKVGASLEKAKDSKWYSERFDKNMKSRELKDAITKGKRLAGLTPSTFPPMTDSDIDDLMYKCGNYGKGDIDGIKNMIFEFGPKQVVNAEEDFSYTCLHFAAYTGLPNIITLLKENGADLDPKERDGETPLRKAIRYRNYSSITTLIKLGADLEKAKESNYFQSEFDSSMREEKTKAAIAEGQRLAGQIG